MPDLSQRNFITSQTFYCKEPFKKHILPQQAFPSIRITYDIPNQFYLGTRYYYLDSGIYCIDFFCNSQLFSIIFKWVRIFAYLGKYKYLVWIREIYFPRKDNKSLLVVLHDRH